MARSAPAAAAKARRSGASPGKKSTSKTGPSPTSLSLAELQQLVSLREKEVQQLQRKREQLVRDLGAVDAEIQHHLGGGAASAPRARAATPAGGRPSGSMRGKLPDLIRQVLRTSGGPMKLRDIATGVVDVGYPTSSAKFGVIVGQRIAELKDVTKVGHGVYRLKK